jgi:dTDP-glucose 4,6-dehydratase
MLGLALAKGARFLLASTSEVYGDPQVHPQPETYWGQREPDRAARRLRRGEALRGGDHVRLPPQPRRRRPGRPHLQHLRPAHAHGGRARGAGVHERRRSTACRCTIHGDGLQTRSLSYVDDMVDGFVALLTHDEVGPVNLGSPFEVTMLQLAEAVQDACGSHPGIEFHPRPVDDPQVRRPDTTIARERLGWEATTPLAVGLARTAEWWREQLARDSDHEARAQPR